MKITNDNFKSLKLKFLKICKKANKNWDKAAEADAEIQRQRSKLLDIKYSSISRFH